MQPDPGAGVTIHSAPTTSGEDTSRTDTSAAEIRFLMALSSDRPLHQHRAHPVAHDGIRSAPEADSLLSSLRSGLDPFAGPRDASSDRGVESARAKGTLMRQSRDRILTSHAGSLPRPDDLIEANQSREAGTVTDERAFSARLGSAVADVVRRQREAGIDVPGDGEYGKAMGHRVNYRAWWSYSFQRLGGLEHGTQGLYDVPPTRSRPGKALLTSFGDRRRFAAAYADPESGITTGPRPPRWPVCVGPHTYTWHEAIRADVQHLKA